MSKSNFEETVDKLCVILKIIFEACADHTPIKGSLANTIKQLDNTMPYSTVIPTILRKKGIMEMKKEKGTYRALWYWFSTTEPNRHMCTAILTEVKKQLNKHKPGRKPPLEYIINKAFNLRSEGKTLEEIGSILNRDKSTISKWFKNYKRIEIDVPKYHLTNEEQATNECLENVFGPNEAPKKLSVEDKVNNKILEVSNKLNKLTKELEALKEEESLLEHEKASLHFYMTELQSLLEN